MRKIHPKSATHEMEMRREMAKRAAYEAGREAGSVAYWLDIAAGRRFTALTCTAREDAIDAAKRCATNAVTLYRLALKEYYGSRTLSQIFRPEYCTLEDWAKSGREAGYPA